jgi:hypothetical protein
LDLWIQFIIWIFQIGKASIKEQARHSVERFKLGAQWLANRDCQPCRV